MISSLNSLYGATTMNVRILLLASLLCAALLAACDQSGDLRA